MPLDDPALSSPIALACIFPGAEFLQDFADMLPNGIALVTLFA